MQDFTRRHIIWALCAGAADADGDEDLSRRLRAQTKLRLITMSNEELRELAELNSSPPEKPVELVYKGFKQAIEEHRATVSEWTKGIVKESVFNKDSESSR